MTGTSVLLFPWLKEGEMAISALGGKPPELKLDASAYEKLNHRALCESLLDIYSVREWSPMVGVAAAPFYKIVEERADKRTKDLCGARIFFIDNNLLAASKELDNLKPSDDDPLTLMQAWADFHAREPERARVNLLRFLKAKSQADTLNAEDAVLALALSRRIGMDEPAEITQLASSLRQDAWPLPLFERLRGKLSDQQLQAMVDALPPAAREYAALEMHFYLSQALLANNERRKADVHLNWLRRYSLLGSPFSVLATQDKYSEERADPDMQALWKIQGKHDSGSDIVRHLTAAAARGITVAQSALGWRYVDGNGVTADMRQGLLLLETAAAKGDVDAMNYLGRVYALGKLGTPDMARAVSYYRQAAENGDGYAAYNLGRGYWFGDLGLPVDLEQAFRYMMDAAEMRNTSAEFFVGRMYFEGKGTEKNDALALFWASQGYYKNDSDDKALLGLLLLNLRKDKPGHDAGMKLLMDVVKDGSSYAQLEYARLILRGARNESEVQVAFDWVRRAAEGGNESAKALLGRMYVQGFGVAADVPRGMALLAEQEREKLPDVFNELGIIYRSEKSGMTDKAKAAEYFKRGAELGQREAAQSLAVMLHTGEGVPVDLKQAIHYYELAVKSGFPDAMNNLAEIYQHGEGGISPNPGKAITLQRRAAQLGYSLAMLNLAGYYENNPAAAKADFLSLSYYLIANQYGELEAKEGLARMKAKVDATVLNAAQTFASSWKPGKAMPEEI
jgi:TPR repeat protein